MDDGGMLFGDVKRISAAREVGKSERRRRVRVRWWGVGCCVVVDDGERGVSVSDQASFFRKRVGEFDGTALVDGDVGSYARMCFIPSEIFSPDWSNSPCFFSSHCVSHRPSKKSVCATIPRKTSIFVFTPATCVSDRARRAFRTAAGQDEAVMINLAIKLSKSADTTVEWPCTRCVSTLTPLPAGNWKDVILPIERDQSDCTFSAVMRSWMECAGGGTFASRGVLGKPQSLRDAPCASRSCALTMSVREMLSVMVCSTCRRGLTSRK